MSKCIFKADTTQIINLLWIATHAGSPMTSQTLCCKKLWYFNKVSSKHNLTFFSTSLLFPLALLVSSCLSPMTILCPHCSTHQHSLRAGVGNTVKRAQQCAVKLTATWWLPRLHLALVATWTWKKTTSWNYLSAPSHSVYIVLASCADAARQPGCCSWSGWLLAAAPPLATSLSAPSSSVFIVSGSESWCCRTGTSSISSSLSPRLSLLHFLNSGLWLTNLHRFWQHVIKCEVNHKSHCACIIGSWLISAKLFLWCQDVWVKVASVAYHLFD